ncbi:MAG: peptidoglycan DD-metalloendopeptidase family protein [Firmicutes bacterium]|nr:peptidoglycan DD-metalloendopeptidase family protein [Bacillota bacterium]
MKRSLILTIAFLMALSLSAFVYAAPKDSSDLEKMNDDIKKKQQELDEGKQREKELMTTIVDIEQQIDALQVEIANSQEDLKVLEADLKEAEAKVDKQNRDLSARLRNMYKNGSVGFMDVLLNSGSFSDFMTNLDMVQRVYQSDADVLKQMQESYAEIEQKKQEVEALRDALVTAEATAEQEVAAVAAQKEKLSESNKATEEAIDDLKEEMASLEAELAAKQAEGAVSSSDTSEYTGGVFAWPTPGNTTITSGYGWRRCPFHGREFHAALDIGAPSGAPIVAAADGKVIHSGWYGGFGKSVIVDHGGGLVSQYNHCSSTLVSVGDKVKKGQTIAKVGSTGYSTGPHLDFRVYKNGDVVDPRGYLK